MGKIRKLLNEKWFEILVTVMLGVIVTIGGFYVQRVRFIYRSVEYHHDLRNIDYTFSNIPKYITPTKDLTKVSEFDQLEIRVDRMEKIGELIPVFEKMFLIAEQEHLAYASQFSVELNATQNNRDPEAAAGIYVNLVSPKVGFLAQLPMGSIVLVRANDSPIWYPMIIKATFSSHTIDENFRTHDIQMNKVAQQLVGLDGRLGIKSVVIKLQIDPNATSPALFHISNFK